MRAATAGGRPQSRHAAPKTTAAKPHHRSDRQVDAASDDDRCQRDRQESELHAEARDLEEVPGRGEVRGDDREERRLRRQCDEQDRVTGWETLEGPDHCVGGMRAQCQQVGKPQLLSLSKSLSPQSSQRAQSNTWLCVLSALRGERLLDSEGRWGVEHLIQCAPTTGRATVCVTGRSRRASNATAARMIAP